MLSNRPLVPAPDWEPSASKQAAKRRKRRANKTIAKQFAINAMDQDVTLKPPTRADKARMARERAFRIAQSSLLDPDRGIVVGLLSACRMRHSTGSMPDRKVAPILNISGYRENDLTWTPTDEDCVPHPDYIHGCIRVMPRKPRKVKVKTIEAEENVNTVNVYAFEGAVLHHIYK